MKPRIRGKSPTPRNISLPIRLNDDEYTLIIDAAHAAGVTPSTYIAIETLKQAAKLMNRQFNATMREQKN